MSEGNHRQGEGPKISLQQISVAPGCEQGEWLITWRVENPDRRPLHVDAARLPHSQFKAGEQRFRPSLILGYGEATQFESTVLCAEPAGATVENAFIIFSAVWLERRWRIFVRLRIVVDDQGKPKPITESITTQQVGFSADFQPAD
jgi:hypothetical protein